MKERTTPPKIRRQGLEFLGRDSRSRTCHRHVLCASTSGVPRKKEREINRFLASFCPFSILTLMLFLRFLWVYNGFMLSKLLSTFLAWNSGNVCLLWPSNEFRRSRENSKQRKTCEQAPDFEAHFAGAAQAGKGMDSFYTLIMCRL